MGGREREICNVKRMKEEGREARDSNVNRERRLEKLTRVFTDTTTGRKVNSLCRGAVHKKEYLHSRGVHQDRKHPKAGGPACSDGRRGCNNMSSAWLCSFWLLPLIILNSRPSVNVDAQTSGAKISTGASSASGQSAVIQTVSGYQPQIPTLMYQVPFPGPLMQQHPASGVQQASPVVQQTLPLGGPMWIQQPQQAFNNQPAQVVYSNQLPPFPLQPTQVLQQIQHPNAQVVYVLPHPSQPVNQPYFSPQVYGQLPGQSQIVNLAPPLQPGNQTSPGVHVLSQNPSLPMGVYSAPSPMQAGGYPSYYSVVYLSPSLPAQPPEQDSKGTEPRETSGNNSSAGSGTASPRSSQGNSSPQAKMTITPFPEPPAPAALVSPQAQVQNLNQVQSPGGGPPQDQSRGQATTEIRTPAPTPQPPPTSAVTSAPPEKKPVMGQVGSNSTNSAKTKTSSSLQHGSTLPRQLHSASQTLARQLGVTQYYEAHGCLDPGLYLPQDSQGMTCAMPQAYTMCRVVGQLHRATRGHGLMGVGSPLVSRGLLETCLSQSSFRRQLMTVMGNDHFGIDPFMMSSMMGTLDGDIMMRAMALMNMMSGGGSGIVAAPLVSPSSGINGGGREKATPAPSSAAGGGVDDPSGMCSLVLHMLLMRTDVGMVLPPDGIESMFDMRRTAVPYQCQDLRAGLIHFSMCCPNQMNSPSMMDLLTTLFT